MTSTAGVRITSPTGSALNSCIVTIPKRSTSTKMTGCSFTDCVGVAHTSAAARNIPNTTDDQFNPLNESINWKTNTNSLGLFSHEG